MPRALRIEYPGAIYHVMNRGDRRELIVRDPRDHQRERGVGDEEEGERGAGGPVPPGDGPT